ncbi:MAG TPA: type II secretion system inner membrane protein GspF [Burkholderiales bacterium]|nr:type II secretion system inner membrane protein GspF [Burkholderiales bacterium]
MTAFRYEAVDREGKVVRGVVEVDTVRQARSHLRGMDLYPVSVDSVSQDAISGSDLPWRRRRFSSTQLSLFTRQFSTLLSAGLTVENALDALVEQSEDDHSRQILAGVRGEVLSGQTLSNALSQYGRVFPEIYRALVHAGEESGELAEVMLRLADYVENRHALRQKVMLAFLYPAAVSLVATAVITGLLVYVVPQVVGVFRQSHQALPFLTRALIASSDFLRKTGFYWLALILAGIWAGHVALSRESLRKKWHGILLDLPVFGTLIKGLDTARFANTLAILAGSGVPLLNALKAGAMVVQNLVLREAIEDAVRMVTEGAPLSRALAGSRRFPPILIHLISSGEASGRLAPMLERASRQQETEMEGRTAWLTGLMEPLLIVAMGGIVLLIVLAIMLPIIDMNQLVR